MKRFLVLAFLILPWLVTCGDDDTGPMDPEPPDPAVVDFWLTLLHNNDGESQLIDAGSGREDFGGLARFATLVDELRDAGDEAPANRGRLTASQGAVPAVAILVSSGDNYLAGPEFGLSLEMGIPFFDAIGLDLIGYDALAIGNHEFDFGPDVLADFIESFSLTTPPFLSSNLDVSQEPRLQALVGSGRIAESVIVEKEGERIGIIGATTPDLPFISSPRNVVVQAAVAAEIQTEVTRLEGMGIDRIVLISHLQSLDEDLALIPQLDGVDIVVAGGGDELLANADDTLIPGDAASTMFPGYPITATDMDGTDVPVVTTSGSYQYVGRLVVGFNGLGDVIEIHDLSGPVRVAGGANPDAVAPDPAVQAQVIDPVVDGLADLAATVLGVSEVALDGRRTEVRSRETNEGNLIADALKWQAEQLADDFGVPLPDVALQNGGGIRNDVLVPAGNITELEAFNMVPFANFVSVVENVSRAQFKDLLENAVSDLPGGGRFAQVSGFRFTYDPDAADGARVIDITLDDATQIVVGGVVQDGADLVVATIDFLARGGDEYPFGDAPFTTLGVTYQQALFDYIAEGLAGVITAADYPEGGEGRITAL
ncbi:MAG TPA: 5'-nucleotidase C-terminal domain-containing protein [Gemmatimonadota bacterium]|nr:5'-nucleotidase C-terminal domain-containing protein [Gemmatimonadota bacterium]